ncbi:TRAP transporter small permease [Granulosicoccus sp. 3-233]|uniref:TRAP transporter small permease n=1 Tax=Granulosicoccus sp. 3-233 TaxID=3417969 RepID=UPI003D34D68D
MTHGLPGWLQRRADNVAVLLLSATFLIFILQIVSRYLFRAPLGWTLEACLLCWVWLVFWSGAFTLKDQDHVRFTILLDHCRPGTRRVFAVLSGICIVALLGVSLWPTIDFVQFMAIESTSLLKIRFDVFFSIYIVFSIAVMLRYATRAWLALCGTLDV